MKTKKTKKLKNSKLEKKIDRVLAEHEKNRKVLLQEQWELLKDTEEYLCR